LLVFFFLLETVIVFVRANCNVQNYLQENTKER